MEECPNIRCYKIRVETPSAVMQSVETTWAGLKKEDYIEQVETDWKEFGRRHNVEVKLDVKEIPCLEAHRIKRFFRKKKGA